MLRKSLFEIRGGDLLVNSCKPLSRKCLNCEWKNRNHHEYALRLFEQLPKNSILTQARVVEILGLTKPTALKNLSILVDAGVLVEVTGKKRDRVFHYHRYLEALCSGTELL